MDFGLPDTTWLCPIYRDPYFHKKSGRVSFVWEEREREREIVRQRCLFLFFLLFVSFLDLRTSDHRFSSGLNAKLIHAARTTRGYQNLGVSSNSTR